MKISLGDLRRLIKENLENEEWIPEKILFYSILKNLADGNEWKGLKGLQVTHESLMSNKESIDKEGIKRQSESHGIYFTVGWYDSPRFVTNGIMARIIIPKRYLDPEYVVPDDRFGSGDEGYDEFMNQFPDVVGGEIGTTFKSIPRNWIKEIIEA